MNFSWIHPFLLEKANDESLLGAVEHFENFTRQVFSRKKGCGLETWSLREELLFIK
jgi:hypothetical protein